MIVIKPIMNSAVEDIFAFKTCCGAKFFDQNLELMITNTGNVPVRVLSHCDLEGAGGSHRIANLMPHGPQEILPGYTVSFYCMMDDALWEGMDTVTFYDTLGRAHTVGIDHRQDGER